MKIGVQSRFCDNCQKSVMDFTTMTREQILEYILTRPQQKICGKIYPSQIDFSNTDLLVTIQVLAKQHKNTNLSFYLLTMGAMIMAGCSNADEELLRNPATHQTAISMDTTSSVTLSNTQTSSTSKSVKKHRELTIPEPVFLLGDVIAEPHFRDTNSTPYPDKMPEYVGGEDDLMTYLKHNIKYPKWELDSNIQGTVYVRFTIDIAGKVKEPEIIRSVRGSRNFDAEVIRVISSMPDWIPAELNKSKIDMKFTMPVKFMIDN